MNNMEGLTIGEVARRADVNVETLRYYERRGLLARPQRSASNYRIYAEGAVRRIRFIKRAQELGFSLREIVELLSLRASPRSGCADVLVQATTKIIDIDEKIKTLRSMRKALVKLAESCKGSGPASECPILEALEE